MIEYYSSKNDNTYIQHVEQLQSVMKEIMNINQTRISERTIEVKKPDK
jgi:hypothetical protein